MRLFAYSVVQVHVSVYHFDSGSVLPADFLSVQVVGPQWEGGEPRDKISGRVF